jgi:hypothetical protein
LSASVTPRTSASFKEQWFGPITSENVEAVIAQLGKGWYALGVLYLVPYCFLAWIEGVYSANVVDGFLKLVDVYFCLTGGYFLIRRKSRALAGALLAYALFGRAYTFLRWFGVIATQGGINILLAAFAVILAWRGYRATSIYQRKMGHKVSWKHVSWILLSIILDAAVVCIVTSIFLKLIFPQINEDMVGNLTVAVMAAFAVASLTTLTRRYPFHFSPAEPNAMPPKLLFPDDQKKSDMANAIAELLGVQLLILPPERKRIENDHGYIYRKAIGYIYGYIDAFLRMQGINMSNIEIGVPDHLPRLPQTVPRARSASVRRVSSCKFAR